MNAKEFLDAGRLSDAIQVLNAEVRDHPTDTKRRTFLFELLCFAGEFDRAAKQLDVLAQDGPTAATGCLVYRSALHAEKLRQDMFTTGDYWKNQKSPELEDSNGSLNGKPFQTFIDSDYRIGPRLEVFAAGAYLWIPYKHIVSIEIAPPQRLRDLLWAVAHVKTSLAFEGPDLGEVLLPVIAPLSYRDANENVKLGRETHWHESESGGAFVSGQKTFLVDDDEVPFLEVRRIDFQQSPS